jgi:hypothetical protein
METDKRQFEIKEGAGLEESRLNTEFVDFLKKWSTPVLVVLAAIALAYLGLRKYGEYKDQLRDTAWTELIDAQRSRAPATLLRVAEEHAGIDAVPLIARTEAADVFLLAATTGLAPGAELDAQSMAPKNPDDVLTAERREQMLAQAAEQFQKVADAASANARFALHEMVGYFGLAAVAESRERFDEAKAFLGRAGDAASRAGFPAHAQEAKRRAETMDQLRTVPRLFKESEVVTKPQPPSPGQISLPGFPAGTLTPISPPTLPTPSLLPGGGAPATTPPSSSPPSSTPPDSTQPASAPPSPAPPPSTPPAGTPPPATPPAEPGR